MPDGSARAGGLEVAIRAALRSRGGLWFGWSGRVADNAPGPAKTVDQDNISYVTVDLRKDDYDEFYNGFANRVLWPILHYRLDLAEFTRRDLGGYFRVNEYFANHLEKLLKPDDVIWVHDYHLIRSPRRCATAATRTGSAFSSISRVRRRKSSPRCPITSSSCRRSATTTWSASRPRPTPPISRAISSMNAASSASSDDSFAFDNRVVQVGVFPVGVETEAFSRLARRAIESGFVREVLESLSGRAMIIGVDRLDYSKGIPERMDAFERFLTNFPDWRGKVTYLQITPRSRSGIPEYADISRKVGEAVGRINGTFGEASWTPLRYINKAHSRTALAGLYRGARAALVTPLRDGMNLVAKEYIAAQDAADPGVLILSRFAGAARECGAALLVNPYDPEGVAIAINRALSMPLRNGASAMTRTTGCWSPTTSPIGPSVSSAL